MVIGIGRRRLITALGSAAVAWPFAARAQQPILPMIGFLNGQKAGEFKEFVAAFNRGLNEIGFVESQNVVIEYRWAEGKAERLPGLADELVRRRVALIAATGGAGRAAKAATNTIPIVASIGGDAVRLGLVASINRPGGNFTGVAVFTSDLEAKRLQLLHELIPKGATIGVLIDPKFDASISKCKRLQLRRKRPGEKS